MVFFMLKTHVMKMNTENTNCFIYETEELLFELLGGVRIDTLDRMRVTMKVSVLLPAGVTLDDIVNPIKPDKPIRKDGVPPKKTPASNGSKMPRLGDAGSADKREIDAKNDKL